MSENRRKLATGCCVIVAIIVGFYIKSSKINKNQLVVDRCDNQLKYWGVSMYLKKITNGMTSSVVVG